MKKQKTAILTKSGKLIPTRNTERRQKLHHQRYVDQMLCYNIKLQVNKERTKQELSVQPVDQQTD